NDKYNGKALRCAELLVHKQIPVSAIVSAEVANFNLMTELEANFGLFTTHNPEAFFALAYPQEISYADICFR
ncbi:MAG: hypothetical protein NWQ54_14955, partial [Paraglaciecola sp.]|nr:hypothetical protein [Paraglaciecola sp.]